MIHRKSQPNTYIQNLRIPSKELKKEFIAWSPNVILPFTTQQVLTTNGRIYLPRKQDNNNNNKNDKRNGIGSLSTKQTTKS